MRVARGTEAGTAGTVRCTYPGARIGMMEKRERRIWAPVDTLVSYKPTQDHVFRNTHGRCYVTYTANTFLRKGEVGTKDEHGRRYCDPSVARRCVETGVRATKTGALGLLRSGLGRGVVRDGASNRKLIE
jgi:hypothetical protein